MERRREWIPNQPVRHYWRRRCHQRTFFPNLLRSRRSSHAQPLQRSVQETRVEGIVDAQPFPSIRIKSITFRRNPRFRYYRSSQQRRTFFFLPSRILPSSILLPRFIRILQPFLPSKRFPIQLQLQLPTPISEPPPSTLPQSIQRTHRTFVPLLNLSLPIQSSSSTEDRGSFASERELAEWSGVEDVS